MRCVELAPSIEPVGVTESESRAAFDACTEPDRMSDSNTINARGLGFSRSCGPISTTTASATNSNPPSTL